MSAVPTSTIVHRSEDRGVTSIGWLESRHTFSFGEYFDPAKVQFRSLRVINDDIVAPATGFGMHAHRDMEIITVVLSGALEHRDSLGHGEVLRPGEVQVMSAGSGIRHSEKNPSTTEPVHLLQIWIMPDRAGRTPRYEQRAFAADRRRGRLCRVAAGTALETDDAIAIGQDASLLLGSFRTGERAEHALSPGHAAWVHVATGQVTVNATRLSAGDAISIEGEPTVIVEGTGSEGEILLVDFT